MSPRSTAGRVTASLLPLLVAPALLAAQGGLTVTQKNTFSMGRLGSGDLQQTVLYDGAQKQKTVTEGRVKFLIVGRDASGTDLIRLDQGQVYRINDKKKQYQAQSLAETRAEIEKAQREMASAQPSAASDEDVRLWVETKGFQRTGEKKQVNGFSTERGVLEMVVMGENRETGEKAPVFYLTSDVWVDPSQKEAARVTNEFYRAYAKELGVDPRSRNTPFTKWLGEMYKAMDEIEGYPILSTVKIEVESAEEADGEARPSANAAADQVGAAVGGLMKRFGKKKEEPAAAAAPAPAAAPGRSVVFTSTTEVLSITNSRPDAGEFEVPAGYKQQK